jgi:hypothetical protein
MKALTFKVNSYLAVLVVTIFGVGASMLIVHIANTAEDLQGGYVVLEGSHL